MTTILASNLYTAALPEIVKCAMLHTVTDIGQLSVSERKILNSYVKKGYLAKGKGGEFPILKTVYAVPTYDFVGEREFAIKQLFSTIEALGENLA